MDSSEVFSFGEIAKASASGSKVICCDISSDGKLLATGGHDKKAVLWCTKPLQPKSSLEEHSMLITDDVTVRLRFQPRNGKYLATASEKAVFILDGETQVARRSPLQGHFKTIQSVCWDSAGDYLASISEDSVRIWSFTSGHDGEFVHELNCSSNKFRSCIFHPTYPSLLVIGCYKSLQLWDTRVSKSITLNNAHDDLVAGLAASSEPGHVASLSLDNIIKLWK